MLSSSMLLTVLGAGHDAGLHGVPRVTPNETLLIEQTIQANVCQSIEDLFRGAAGIRERVANGTLKVAGAVYDIEHGGVTWLDEPSSN